MFPKLCIKPLAPTLKFDFTSRYPLTIKLVSTK
nr:MAG TPA: hypothetical protein [Caudoviricetes sp.]